MTLKTKKPSPHAFLGLPDTATNDELFRRLEEWDSSDDPRLAGFEEQYMPPVEDLMLIGNDAPASLSINEEALYRSARKSLGLRTERGLPPSPLCELVTLIYRFRHDPISDDMAPLRPLARAIRWQPKLPTKGKKSTWALFNEYRASIPNTGPDDVYMLLVTSALCEMRERTRELTPQPIRIQRSWVGGSSKNKVVPIALPVAQYVLWFRSEVTKSIKQMLRNGDEQKATVPAKQIADLHRLAKQAENRKIKLSPTQSRIFDLIRTDPDLQTYAAIESRLSLGTNTVKQHVQKIKTKLRR